MTQENVSELQGVNLQSERAPECPALRLKVDPSRACDGAVPYPGLKCVPRSLS